LVNELDRPGQVIGINTDDSVGVWLQQHLTAARVRATPDYTLRDAVQWLKNGEVIAFAGGRQRLASATRDVSGLRMLDDSRPKGSRNKLSEEFFRDLCDAWEAFGKPALMTAAWTHPVEFVRLVASLDTERARGHHHPGSGAYV
jgi:hypothetical protein